MKGCTNMILTRECCGKVVRGVLIVSALFGLVVSLVVMIMLVDLDQVSQISLELTAANRADCVCVRGPRRSNHSAVRVTHSAFIRTALSLTRLESMKISTELADIPTGSYSLVFICYILTQCSSIIISVHLILLIKYTQIKVKRILLTKNYISYLSSGHRRRNFVILSYIIVASSITCILSISLFVGSLSIFRFAVGLDNEEALIFWSYITLGFPLIFYKTWNIIMSSVCTCSALGYFITSFLVIHIYISHIMRIVFLLLVAYFQSKVLRLYFFRGMFINISKSKKTSGYLPSYQCGDNVVNSTYSGKLFPLNKNSLKNHSNHNINYDEESTAF